MRIQHILTVTREDLLALITKAGHALPTEAKVVVSVGVDGSVFTEEITDANPITVEWEEV